MSAGARGGVRALIERLADFGDRPAAGLRGEYGLRWVSYRALLDRAWDVAAVLADVGLARGDHILIWSSNCPEWLACLLGALSRGIVVVSVDDDASPALAGRVVKETGARFVFHRAGIDPACLGIPAMPLDRISAPRAYEQTIVDAAATDPAVIIYTSGSTTEPRGVILTFGNIESQVRRFLSWRWLFRIVPMRMLVIAPLSHVQGLMLGAFIPLSVGLSVVFVRSVHSTHLLRTIRDNRIVVLAAVPRVLTTLKYTLEARPYGTATLRERLEHEHRGWVRRHRLFTACNRAVGWRFWVILVGGASLGRDEEQFWRDTGRYVIQGYGLTETTAIVAINGPFSRKVGSIGKALKHVALRVAPDGELLVRAESVSPGYVLDERAPRPEDDGYLPTGDLIRASGGSLYFVGRKKELIVTSEGHNVAPAAVESVLTRIAGVIDAVVTPGAIDGADEVHAVLLLQPAVDAAAVVRQANTALEPYQRIRGWTVWVERDFPRTALLKPRRADIASRVNANMTASALMDERPEQSWSVDLIAAEPSRSARVELIARHLAQTKTLTSDEAAAGLASHFGLSSLDYVDLLGRLEALEDVDIDHAWLPEEPTLGDVHNILRAGASAAPPARLPHRQPWWADLWPGQVVRAVVRPLLVGVWQALRGRCSAEWAVPPAALQPPVVFAVAPHHHWLDAFIVSAALPERLARRMLVVTNRDFGEFFDPARGAPWTERLTIALGYYSWLPMTFPFTILRGFGTTREGLLETLRWVDRRYCPLVFPKGILFGPIDPARHDPGAALIAREAGISIVPVWIRGNESCGWLPRFSGRGARVLFGVPTKILADESAQTVEERVEAAWDDLRQASASMSD